MWDSLTSWIIQRGRTKKIVILRVKIRVWQRQPRTWLKLIQRKSAEGGTIGKFLHGVSGSYSTPPPSEFEVIGTIFDRKLRFFYMKEVLRKNYQVRGIQEGSPIFSAPPSVFLITAGLVTVETKLDFQTKFEIQSSLIVA